MPMTIGSSDTLYIRISKDRIVFARYDRIKDSTLNFSTFPVNGSISLNANMLQALKRQPLAKGDFSQVFACIDCPVTLVPLNEFDDEEMETIYLYNLPDSAKGRKRVFYDMLPMQNAVMLGCIEKDLEHVLHEAFPYITLHSTQMPMLLHWSSLCKPTEKAGKVFVNIQEDKMTLAAFREGNISLLNSFDGTQETMNALYYLMNFLQQWNIQPTVDEIYLTGIHPLNTALLDHLRKYYPNTFALKMEKDFIRYVATLAHELPYDMIALLLKAF